MAKSTSVDDALARLALLRSNRSAPGVKEEVSRALASKTNLIATRAAKLAGEFNLRELTPDLIRAFDRFIVSSDKGCEAKTAIADALYTFGADAESVFLTGVRHVQMEPVWGGSADSAALLRGTCALGLVRIAHRDALEIITDLLMDPEPQARMMAARALAYAEREEGVMLLRLKLLAGDREADVLAECLAALVKLAPQKSLPFIARFLDASNPAVRDAAALALGASRQPAAFDLLHRHWDRPKGGEIKRTLLIAMVTLRLPPALDFVLGQITAGTPTTAIAAIEALAIYRRDETMRAKVNAAVTESKHDELRAAFESAFDEHA